MSVVEVTQPGPVLVIDSPGQAVVRIEPRIVKVIEVAKQGPPGPPATDAFDTDLALLFEIEMLP